MSNLLIISMSSNQIMTYFRPDQNYSNLAEIAEACRVQHFPLESVSKYALCDTEETERVVDGGKNLLTGSVSGGGDFSIKLKSAVTTETIIPPSGVSVADIPSTDNVVCYT